jgi:hypothetical protein
MVPDSVPGRHHIYSQARYDELHPNIHAYPPPLLHGADSSKREEDEIYGVNIGSAKELEAGLSQAGLSSASVKAMAAGMVDVVAIPGMSAGGTSDSEATSRQDTLMLLERKVKTHDWAKRVNMSLFAMIVVDTYLVYSQSTDSEWTQKDFYHDLAEDLIDNNFDGAAEGPEKILIQTQRCQARQRRPYAASIFT